MCEEGGMGSSVKPAFKSFFHKLTSAKNINTIIHQFPLCIYVRVLFSTISIFKFI